MIPHYLFWLTEWQKLHAARLSLRVFFCILVDFLKQYTNHAATRLHQKKQKHKRLKNKSADNKNDYWCSN